MAPAPRAGALRRHGASTAPPTRESVTDNEGLLTTGSDPFKYMVWLAFVAQPFFELYTTGRITTHKHTVVASAKK